MHELRSVTILPATLRQSGASGLTDGAAALLTLLQESYHVQRIPEASPEEPLIPGDFRGKDWRAGETTIAREFTYSVCVVFLPVNPSKMYDPLVNTSHHNNQISFLNLEG